MNNQFGDVVQGVEQAGLNDAGCHVGVPADAGSHPAVSTTVQEEVAPCDSQQSGPPGQPAARDTAFPVRVGRFLLGFNAGRYFTGVDGESPFVWHESLAKALEFMLGVERQDCRTADLAGELEQARAVAEKADAAYQHKCRAYADLDIRMSGARLVIAGLRAELATARARIAELEHAILNAHLALPSTWVYTGAIDTLDLLVAEIKTLQLEKQWRPIAEAPKDGRWMPLWMGEPIGWVKGQWRLFAECWVDEFNARLYPTHFLPAPLPPKEAS